MFVPRTPVEGLWPWAGEKMIFIHTPKCGGSFVADAFGIRFRLCPTLRWREAAGHLTYLEYQKVFFDRGQHIHDYKLFTVIRNPWDWHLSWYNYVGKDTGGKHSGMPLEHAQIKDLSFSDYLKWLGDGEIEKSQDDYCRKQVSDWITDTDGTIRVDNVLRQESLQADLEAFQLQYGLRLNIAHDQRVNSSRQDRDYRQHYSSHDAEIIANRHQADINLFGYSFE